MSKQEVVVLNTGTSADGIPLAAAVNVQRAGDFRGGVIPTQRATVSNNTKIADAGAVQVMQGWDGDVGLEDSIVYVCNNSAGLAAVDYILFDSLGYMKEYTYTAASYALFQNDADRTLLLRQATSFFPVQYKGFRVQVAQNAANLNVDLTIQTFNLKGAPLTTTRLLNQGTNGSLFNANILMYDFDAPQPILPNQAILVPVAAGETMTFTFYPFAKLNVLTRA